MIKNKENHSRELEKILKYPKLIGIEGIDLSEKELILRKQKEIFEIDLIICYKEHSYFIEYKQRDCLNNEEKAKKQLERIERNLFYLNKRYLRDRSHFLYVAGDVQSVNRKILELKFDAPRL